MSVMVQALGKRAACNRCHGLKMRCVVDEAAVSSQCNRCRSARVACNYSSPGKPGRPTTKATGTVTATRTGGPQRPISTQQQRGSTHSQRREHQYLDGLGVAGYAECTSSTLLEPPPTVGQGYDCWPVAEPFAGLTEAAPISPESASWRDTIPLLDRESCTVSPWDSVPGHELWPNGRQQESNSHGSPEICNYNPEEHHLQTRQNRAGLTQGSPIPGQSPFGVLSEPSTADSASSGAPALSSPTSGRDNQKYLQQLSELNARLSSPAALHADGSPSRPVRPAELSQAAAHVLENSAVFFDLVCIRPSCQAERGVSTPESEAEAGGASLGVWQRRPSTGSISTPTFVPDMAARLQLLVSYMRLTELHHGLYAAIYRYLSHSARDAVQPGQPERERRPLLGLSIAGVALAPHPHFELQLLLQTSTHYLGCIQEALDLPLHLRLRGRLGTHRCDASDRELATPESRLLGLPGSAGTSMLMHTLMMPDQEHRLGAIAEILGRLKDEFGIVS